MISFVCFFLFFHHHHLLFGNVSLVRNSTHTAMGQTALEKIALLTGGHMAKDVQNLTPQTVTGDVVLCNQFSSKEITIRSRRNLRKGLHTKLLRVPSVFNHIRNVIPPR